MIYRDANRVARCEGCDAIAVDQQWYSIPSCIPEPGHTRDACVFHRNGCPYNVDVIWRRLD
jgi:hypothetical protein